MFVLLSLVFLMIAIEFAMNNVDHKMILRQFLVLRHLDGELKIFS